MLINIGFFICLFSIIAGYLLEGGNLGILLQPFSALIIIGTALGIFLISNPRTMLKAIIKSLPKLYKGSAYSKKDYLKLLVFLFFFFRFVRQKNIVEIEAAIESPELSKAFTDFPYILRNKQIVTYICDHIRMLVLGMDNIFELENMMENQIYLKKVHTAEISGAFYKLGESLPAIGIIAAVLGIINAMGSLSKSPHIIGAKIATALLGTLLGIIVAYCIVNPIGSFLEKFGNDEAKILECLKAAIIAHARGNPPSLTVEFARQAIPENLKPTFHELEKTIEKAKGKLRK